MQVAEGCGFVPLALAVAGSVRVSGVPPVFPGWDELPVMLQNARGSGGADACPERGAGEADACVDGALSVSFARLSKLRKHRFLMLGATAKGSPLPLELLRSLWDYPVSRSLSPARHAMDASVSSSARTTQPILQETEFLEVWQSAPGAFLPGPADVRGMSGDSGLDHLDHGLCKAKVWAGRLLCRRVTPVDLRAKSTPLG